MAQKRDTLDMLDTSPGKGPAGGKIIGLVIALLVIGGAALGYYFFSGDSQKEVKVATVPAPPSTTKTMPEKPPVKVEPPVIPPTPAPGPSTGVTTSPPTSPPEPPKPVAKTEPPAVVPPKALEKPTTPPVAAPEVKPVQEVIHFGKNQYQIKTAEAALLKEFWAKIKGSGGTLTIEGHSCALGPADYNQKLSEQRAQQVAKMLESLGMDKQFKVTIKGYGMNQPMGDNKTPQGRAENRRVVISYTQEK
jgi:outer membrane protein OmpA-like peptidoglycan-associated protein